MKFKNIYLLIASALMFSLPINTIAQDYTTAIGIKAGKFSSGLSARYFFDTSSSIGLEGNLTFKKNFGTALATVFVERQTGLRNRILQAPIDFIYGVGAHVAMYKEGYYRIRNGEKDQYYGKGMSIGLDAIVGLEHPFSFAPLTVGIEVNPFYDIVNPGPEFVDIAVSVRYAFR